LALDVSELLESVLKSFYGGSWSSCQCEKTDASELPRLLRPRGQWPRRSAAEKRDELSPLHSIKLHPLVQPTPGQDIASVRMT